MFAYAAIDTRSHPTNDRDALAQAPDNMDTELF